MTHTSPRLALVACAAALLLTGAEALAHPNHHHPRPTTVIGEVVGSGVSRGKTIAAWNGIAPGRLFLRITPKPGTALRHAPKGVTPPLLVELPPWMAKAPAEGTMVTLTGAWRAARPMPKLSPDEPVPQMPIEPAPVVAQPIEQRPIAAEPAGAEPAGAEPAGAEPAGAKPPPPDPNANPTPEPTAWRPVPRVPVFVVTALEANTP